MNVIRIAISLFILVLITVCVAGWIWTGTHQPASQALAGRTVLTLAMMAGLGGLAVLWRATPPK
jgi:hypothetical protein